VKMFTALKRFLHRPQPKPAPRRFDDGLAEIARLIAREVPAEDAEVPPKAPSQDRASTN
jgi:hypothetical protein